MTHDGCQVCALVGYFGETRTEPCGHCSHCLTGRAQQLPEPEPKPPIETIVDADALAALRDATPTRSARRDSRRDSSPASRARRRRRAKLTRDPLFGSLAERRFADVLAWCETALV